MQGTFDIDGDAHNDVAILAEMGRMYRTHRYRLHRHFKKFGTKDEALRNKPDIVTDQLTWEYLCNQFNDPEFIVCF